MSHQLKKYLFFASANPLKLWAKYVENNSFVTLHSIYNQATPEYMIKYKTALMLYKIYNDNSKSFEWQHMFFVQNFNEPNQMANFFYTGHPLIQGVSYDLSCCPIVLLPALVFWAIHCCLA